MASSWGVSWHLGETENEVLNLVELTTYPKLLWTKDFVQEQIDKGTFQFIKLLAKKPNQRKHMMEHENSNNVPQAKTEMLTSRQINIIAHIAVGDTENEIAGKLRISPQAVKTEIDRIFSKIKASNRVQATLWAAKNL